MPTRALTDEEIQKILKDGFNPKDKFYHRNILLFVLQLTTGFRIHEMLEIKIKNIYDVKKQRIRDEISLPRSVMKAKKKGRSMCISPIVHKYIQNYLDWKYEHIPIDGEHQVFYSQKNAKMSNRQGIYIFKTAIKQAGLLDNNDYRLATHSLRKTFCQRFAKAVNNDIFKLFEILGHSNINSTVHYMKTNQEENFKVAKGLFNDLENNECDVEMEINFR
jgi:site-specific recombinase XerD